VWCKGCILGCNPTGIGSIPIAGTHPKILLRGGFTMDSNTFYESPEIQLACDVISHVRRVLNLSTIEVLALIAQHFGVPVTRGVQRDDDIRELFARVEKLEYPHGRRN
jgi:hypothetical protein